MTTTPLNDGRFRHESRCGVVRETTQPRLVRSCPQGACAKWVREHPLQAYASRPGAMLAHLLAELGIVQRQGCGCQNRARQMDDWGVEGCREHRAQIAAWLRTDLRRYGWRERLRAAVRAVRTGLAFRLNPFDLFTGLVDEAIRRAEQHSGESERLDDSAGRSSGQGATAG
ncbi:MAG: hypothetical protein DWQ37_01945 [Planctomycetota bacterium]|nr:MAG: hypothetical protein DWQ37_01945 [Planctomycetota bacterium]